MYKKTLYDSLKEDIRYQEGLKACINCGTCTAICPAAGVSDYDPREVVDIVQSGSEDDLRKLLSSDTIWRCGECLSCKTRCPRSNTPAYIIQALRALSIESGLFRESHQGRMQRDIMRTMSDHMLEYGYCVYFDGIDTEKFPEQGPVWDWIKENKEKVLERLGCSYKQDRAGSLRAIPKSSLDDLKAIFKETGAMERFKKLEEL